MSPLPPADHQRGRPLVVAAEVLDALDRLASAARTALDVDDLLQQLCTAVDSVCDLGGVGVMRVREGRAVHVHATDGRAGRLEELQDLMQQGPSVQAVATQRVVAVDDLSGTTPWPELGEAAAEVRLRSAVSLPLTRGDGVWGVLDLYRSQPGAPEPEELRLARTLADVASGFAEPALKRDAPRTEAAPANSALHDPVTGVAAQALLSDRLQHALAVARRSGRRVGVLVVALDDLARADDAYGSPVGDPDLVGVARRLREVVRAGDTLARTGREFVVLCEDLPAVGAELLLALVAQRVHRALAGAGRAGDVAVRARVGAVIAELKQDDPDTVLAAADRAVEEARQEARGESPADVVRLRSVPLAAGGLQLLVSQRGDERLLRLRGDLDVATVGALREVLDEHARTGHRTVVDLSGLEFADYTGLRVLALPRTSRDGRPHELRVVGASAIVTRVLTLGGLGHLLATGPDRGRHHEDGARVPLPPGARGVAAPRRGDTDHLPEVPARHRPPGQ